MKLKILLFFTCFTLIFSSCIKDEDMYREADIESFDLKDSIFLQNLAEVNGIINIIVSDTTGTHTRKFAPTFTLSNGATSNPVSGDSVLFENYTAIYKVTSEDGSLVRNILVRIVQVVPLKTGFEEWSKTSGLLSYPILKDGLWNTANGGIALATLGKIEEYPTHPTEDAYSGRYAARLETKKGGTYFGRKIPIFSGSLFRGRFELELSNFVKSAKFGQIHPEYMGRPKVFKGVYKYAPGDVFIDENGNEVKGKVDECSIHSVLYRIDKGDVSKESYLTGEDVLTSDRIVAKAILTEKKTNGEYTLFSIPFVYSSTLDYSKYDYRLAVVFASSIEGDFYRGAVGSTLIVDDVEVVCE